MKRQFKGREVQRNRGFKEREVERKEDGEM